MKRKAPSPDREPSTTGPATPKEKKGPISSYDLMQAVDSKAPSSTTASGTPVYSVAPTPVSRPRVPSSSQFTKYALLDRERTCRITNLGIVVVDAVDHVCSTDCNGLESAVEAGLWVCLQSGLTHLCGSRCSFRPPPSDGSDGAQHICPLTGITTLEDDIQMDGYSGGTYSMALSGAVVGSDVQGLQYFDAKDTDPHADQRVKKRIKNANGADTNGPAFEVLDLKRAVDNDRIHKYYAICQQTLHRLIFSNERREVDREEVDKLYVKLGKIYAEHIEQRSKLAKSPDETFVNNVFQDEMMKMLRRSGNVEFGNCLSPQEIKGLFHVISKQATALWVLFLKHECHPKHLSDRRELRESTVVYHLLAMLYEMRNGNVSKQYNDSSRRFFIDSPMMNHLLPNELFLQQIGFNPSEFSRNKTHFRSALLEFQYLFATKRIKYACACCADLSACMCCRWMESDLFLCLPSLFTDSSGIRRIVTRACAPITTQRFKTLLPFQAGQVAIAPPERSSKDDKAQDSDNLFTYVSDGGGYHKISADRVFAADADHEELSTSELFSTPAPVTKPAPAGTTTKPANVEIEGKMRLPSATQFRASERIHHQANVLFGIWGTATTRAKRLPLPAFLFNCYHRVLVAGAPDPEGKFANPRTFLEKLMDNTADLEKQDASFLAGVLVGYGASLSTRNRETIKLIPPPQRTQDTKSTNLLCAAAIESLCKSSSS